MVPRARDLKREYPRKVRTMTRGMETLFFKRALLNPFRYGAFAWMLFSHKICRWLVPWAGVAMLTGMALASLESSVARWFLLVPAAGLLLAVGALRWPGSAPAPRWLSLIGFGLLGNFAALEATIAALRGELNPIWEPTRRDAAASG